MLLALPVLAGRQLELARDDASWAQQLGSDVPFFLLGGTAVGIGRGTETVSAARSPARAGLLVAPGRACSDGRRRIAT